MARIDGIRPAQRPKMFGRAMLSGPSGAGKTFTSLGIATQLAEAEGRPGAILGIDTERESMLTYADVFEFEHLPWRAPYDPTELGDTLGKIGDRFAVIVIDSHSLFWRGQGGTLDIADGKFGGWKTARPVQEALTEAILAVPCHIILCVRSKMEYLVDNSGPKQTVTRMGMAPVQDDTLIYEVNVALDIDMEHRITVTKSRTTALPVGRMYPAGLERKAAADYAEWLAGGIPPAPRADVERIIAKFADIGDADKRKDIKQAFIHSFGMPAALTAVNLAEAENWLTEQIGALDTPPDPANPPADPAPGNENTPDEAAPPTTPDAPETTAEGLPSGGDSEINSYVASLDSVDVLRELSDRGITVPKKPSEQRTALAAALRLAGWTPQPVAQ